MTYVWLLLGFALLIKGADFFVEASSSIAKRLRVPSIIIGLTIVAFGTSAPELAVSTAASISGNNDIALGNVLGSNIFNLLVVLGACGAVRPFRVKLRWDFLATIGIALILLFMIAFDLTVGRVDGIILLILFAGFMGLTVRDALVNRIITNEEIETLSPLRSIIYIVGGLAAIVWGGELVVDSASSIARSFGLSQNLVGLTIVAMGTSLPELVTSIVAARKGENGLALGNVIGSNLFNIMMVLGISSTISPIAVSALSIYDAAFLIVASIITLFLCKSKERISRMEGIVMLALYFSYMVYIVIR